MKLPIEKVMIFVVPFDGSFRSVGKNEMPSSILVSVFYML
jgi:hypothetical protein